MNTLPDSIDLSRRSFLFNSALVVGFSLLPPGVRPAFADTEVDTLGTIILAPDLPGSLRTNPFLDARVAIDPQNHITVYTGKVELGTGVKTALLQIAAERLQVSPAAITFITADTALTPNEGYTAGSHSIVDSGTALLNAAAQVRDLLMQSAAHSWKQNISDLTTRDGTIQGRDGQSMTYGQAVAGVQLHRHAEARSPGKTSSAFDLIGHSLPRVDIPGKITGGASYVQDLRLPGMLHARVIRPPRRGSQLQQVDAAALEKLPGVVKLVRNGSYLAVVAKDEWQAIKAMRVGYASATWSDGNPIPESETIHQLLPQLPAKHYPVSSKGTIAPQVKPTYQGKTTKQYLMHGAIGPSCAVALLKDGGLTLWSHTQGVYPLRAGIAELVGLPVNKVRGIHVEGSGCYGHNGADDAAADAALIAMQVPGSPIRVQWMREQEHLWEPYSSAMLTEVEASLDDSGRITHWKYQLWSTPHNERIVNAGRLLPGWLLTNPFTPAPSVPIAQPEGDGDRNAVPHYDIPNVQVDMNFVTTMPFRTSAMRSLGAHVNIFSIEAAIDELASTAQVDPVQFRLLHLTDPRSRAVVERAAKEFQWPTRAPGPGSGIGFAYARYKNLMGYCAIAVQVHVQRQTGEIVIDRVVTAVDCGQIVSPDGLRNQVQGGIIQSASWSLYEQVEYGPAGIRSYDWSGYPIMRFPALPKQIEVYLLDQPEQPFLGAAEIVQGPMAAALGNAIANATGKRFVNMPLARRGWQDSL
ncbi:MAG: aldehyde dehydrogenase [Pseudomonas sp.]|nr:aldehyde dehydrogenase [Pseudomonas sp.]